MARRNEAADITTRLERRIKALEQVVTLLSKVANVDISNYIRLGVTDEVVIKESLSKRNNTKESFNSLSSPAELSSPLKKNLNVHKAIRHLSVKKLRINIRNPPPSQQSKESSRKNSVTFSIPRPSADTEEPEDKEETAQNNDNDDDNHNQDDFSNPATPPLEDSESLDNHNIDEESESHPVTTSPAPAEPSSSSTTKDIKWEPYKCHRCDKTFNMFKELCLHKKEEHKRNSGWRNCPYCNKRFYGNSKYQHHLRVHTNERPFLCSICGVSLKSEVSLRYHIKTFHEESGKAKTFGCKYCEKKFRTAALAQGHEKIHESSGHICPQCGGTFVNLKLHIESVHEKVRKYACHLCDHKFKVSGHLKRHLKTHDNPNRRVKGYHKERPKAPRIRKKKVFRVFESEGGGQDKGNNENEGHSESTGSNSNTCASEALDYHKNEEVVMTLTLSNNYLEQDTVVGEDSRNLEDLSRNTDSSEA